eukprot:714995-Prymnesium_polylepis.2
MEASDLVSTPATHGSTSSRRFHALARADAVDAAHCGHRLRQHGHHHGSHFGTAHPQQDGDALLHLAADKGHTAAVSLLVAARADVEIKDLVRVRSAPHASDPHHSHIICSAHPVTARGRLQDMETPLFIAAQQGHTDTLQLLLDLGADKDTKNEARRLRFGRATPSRHALPPQAVQPAASLLFPAHARAGPRWQEGASALYAALMSGHEAAARLLIRTGINLEERDVVRIASHLRCAAPRHTASCLPRRSHRVPLAPCAARAHARTRAACATLRTFWSRGIGKCRLQPSARARGRTGTHSSSPPR